MRQKVHHKRQERQGYHFTRNCYDRPSYRFDRRHSMLGSRTELAAYPVELVWMTRLSLLNVIILYRDKEILAEFKL